MNKLLMLLSICFLISCTSNVKKGEELPKYTESEQENDLSKCDNPVGAIFVDTLGLVAHSFESFTSYAIEKVEFPNGLQLEINQSGCKTLKQRYQFNLPTKIDETGTEAAFWVDVASTQFQYMAQKIQQFEIYVQLLQAGKESTILGQYIPVTEDAKFKIDRFIQEANTIVTVEFELLI